jgi:hypothetical protein
VDRDRRQVQVLGFVTVRVPHAHRPSSAATPAGPPPIIAKSYICFYSILKINNY